MGRTFGRGLAVSLGLTAGILVVGAALAYGNTGRLDEGVRLATSLLGLGLVGLVVYLLRRDLGARQRSAAVLHDQRELFRTTLASIGDAVITTDTDGHVTFLNAVAQQLTGWATAEAEGRPLAEVFRIVNEDTRQPTESPVSRSLREGTVVGLANHTVLLARDGTERPIDDSAAPIRGEGGRVAGVVLVFRDVTERRRLERLQRDLQGQLERQVQERTAELRVSEERFRLLVEGTTDYAIFLLDPRGHIISWNPGAERIKQYRPEEIIGQHFSRFYPAQDIQAGKPQWELEVAAAKGKYEEEGWRLRKDGSGFWASVLITALRNPDGSLRGFSKITRDLTERKQAEESARRLLEERAARQAAEEAGRQLRASEARLRLFVEHTPAAVAMFDRDLRYLLVSRRWLTDFDLGDQEVLGRSHYEVIPNLPERWKEVHRRCLAGAVETCDEDHFVLPGGREEWLRWEVHPWRNDRGEVGGILIFSEVITGRKRAEEALRESEEQFRTLADSIPQLAWMARPDGHIFWYNRRWYEYTGTTPAQMEGWGWQSVHDPAELPRVLANWKAALARGEPWEDTFPLRRHDGALRWHLSRAVPLKDERGRVVRWFGTNTDITERREMEEALKGESRRKDEFLAMLAHELRNPLAPIRNGLEILKLPGVDSGTRERARRMMERQVAHMARLLDDLLDVSRISRGRIELRKEPVDLAALVNQTVEAVRPLVAERRHELTVSLPAEPLRVLGDATRLEQVLTNLLNNAAKYTDPGGRIALAVERDDDAAVVQVRDTGTGIAPELLPHVFDLFVQAERRLDRSQGGLGIGLTLVRRLVELHGGTVAAASAGPGRGSEFVLRLPLLPGAEAGGGKKEAGGSEGKAGEARSSPPCDLSSAKRVLVVDDNPDAANSLALLLRLEGQDVRVAYDGPAALALASEFRPQVVLLDLGMPGMDGYEVARRLRQQPGLAGMRLVATTGWGQEEDRRRSREAGFDDHLTKPVEPEALRDLLAQPVA